MRSNQAKTVKFVKIMTFVFVLITCLPTIVGAADIDKLVPTLILKESSGNDRAIGDTNLIQWAYGCLQIRQMCVDDVNRRYGTNIRAEDMLGNRALSIWVCKKYIGMYATEKRLGREPTLEDMARIWNGGPYGWKDSDTLEYWLDVKLRMERGDSNVTMVASVKKAEKADKPKWKPSKVTLSKDNFVLVAKN